MNINLRKWGKHTAFLMAFALVFCLLTVPSKASAAGKMKLSKTTLNMTAGSKYLLKVKNAPKGKKIKWSSNKKKVATVSNKGLITAKKKGNAKITAKVEGKKLICKVTVKAKATTEKTTEAPTTQAPTSVTPTTPTTQTTTVTPSPTTPTNVTPTPSNPASVNTTPANTNLNDPSNNNTRSDNSKSDNGVDEDDSDANKNEHNLSGSLKSKDGNVIKEDIKLSFALKSEYYSGDGYGIDSCSIDKETGLYNINLPVGEYVALLDSNDNSSVGLYLYENGVVGEVNVTEEKTVKDFVFNGYYITGKWSRNDKPMDENINVTVVFTSLENKYRTFNNTSFKIYPDEEGQFYFLSDAFYATSETEINHIVRFVCYGSNTHYKLAELKAYDKDEFNEVINNDYYIVKGKVTNHGNSQIYDFYEFASGQLRRWNDEKEYYEYLSDDEASFKFLEYYSSSHAGDFQFIMAVPAGKYILDMRSVDSINVIDVKGDIQYTSFDFDAYKVTLKPTYTGEAGDTIEVGEDRKIYIYEKDKTSNDLVSFYEFSDECIFYVSPGEYDIRMRLKESYRDKYITSFEVKDEDIEVPFNY